MNDHTMAKMPGRDSPLGQTVIRIGVASTVSLFLVLGLFLAFRRFGGAFDRPLSAPMMILLAICVTALASALRFAWPLASDTRFSVSSLARLALPTLAVFLFCYALSLPGSVPWSVAFLWFVVVGEEGAWWLQNTLARQSRPSPNPPKRNLNDDSYGDRSQPVLADDSPRDVTQQMTRIRDEDGSDLVFGQARAEFKPGDRSQSIHLAFCPPLARSPRINAMQADGPSAAITVAQTEPFGARFDVRLDTTASQAESVLIEFEARCPTSTTPPETQ